MEQKQSQFEGWDEYKVDDVRAFFLILKERYVALIENAADEEN